MKEGNMMPAVQEIYDKTIEGYTVDNDWLYYMDKDETTKHYIPYVYREVSIVFYQDFKTLMAKTDLYSQMIWDNPLPCYAMPHHEISPLSHHKTFHHTLLSHCQ